MPNLAYDELAGLWEAVFGERPAMVTDPGLTARILVRCLPPVAPYDLSLAKTAASEAETEVTTPPS